MRLADTFALLGLPGAPARPAEIRRVVYDSRDVGPGDLFAALPGTRVDGHAFLAQAASHGAEAALVDARWFAEHGDGAPLPCLPL
ncbi:MAG: Mur ligase domain-containing protein, partial [Candidatus Sericytochromatia bacterium]